MPSKQPAESQLRHGLIENDAGLLVCPTCKEPLTTVGMTHTTTDKADTLVLATGLRSYHIKRDFPVGIHGIAVGMQCKADHRVWLTLICDEGAITVKTEWGADEEERDVD